MAPVKKTKWCHRGNGGGNGVEVDNTSDTAITEEII